MKTSDLIGAALDWAVAKAQGSKCIGPKSQAGKYLYVAMRPSTDWAQGGPIIERERIQLTPCRNYWEANGSDGELYHSDTFQTGNTPLIAAMRCYVAGKLGDTIDVPEELK
jgi:hypothetical protein